MAKKLKSFSHIEVQDALEVLSRSNPSGEELVYELLRIFCGYGDGNIRRIREGIGNKAKDGRTILIPNIIAYRPKGELDFHDEIKSMQNDPKIIKQTPRLYVVSDGKTIVAVDPKEQDIYENEVGLMWKDFDFFYPLAGIEKIRNVEEAEADVKSAELMAKIFDEICRHNDIKDKEAMHNLNIFISRLLFCFFAEDTQLFPEAQLFTNSIKQHTSEDGHDLAEFIDRAFVAMSTNEPTVRESLPKQFSIFPYVNGGLFEKRLPIPVLSRRARVLMIKCGDFDWKDINPDIFGSMIQAVVSPEERAGLGMHYTSVPNIMKLIRPLFLDDLYNEFNLAKNTKDIKRLRKLLFRLGKIKFFDPACGSGNFLIVSYKCLRELEIQIWQVLRDWGEPELPISNINLRQFYGIEIDDFACDTTTLSLWLAEHQMNIKFETIFKVRPNALPLRPSGHIVCGNACRLDWNIICPHTAEDEVYVMGNPPYLGFKYQSIIHKEDKNYVFNTLLGYKKLDYITCWFYIAANFISNNIKAKAAFVSTNSICQGEHLSLFWEKIMPLNIEIGFAYTSFKWRNNAKNSAGVTCIIVGIENVCKRKKLLFHDETFLQCDYISPALSIESENIIVEKRSKPISNLPKMILGSLPADGGFLIFKESEYNYIIEKYPASIRLFKQFLGSGEIIKGIVRYCLWITDDLIELAYSIPELCQRFKSVSKYRSRSTKKNTQEFAQLPYKFTENRYCSKDAIAIPITSSENREYIPICLTFNKDVVIYHSACAVYNFELWLFSVLTSKMHNLWVREVGGALETRIRYSATLCYNTYPFPDISELQKTELANLAQEALDIRDQHFDMTLGEMYNSKTMPKDLKEIHHRIDIAVERCYRIEPFNSDKERLECLFKLYAKMKKK